MPTLTISIELTDDELALIDSLRLTSRPTSAGDSWQPPSREAFVGSMCNDVVRARAENKRQEYRRQNANVVLSHYDSLDDAALASVGLERVGLELRHIAVTVPDVVGLPLSTARHRLASVNLATQAVGTHGTVESQTPPAGSAVPARSAVTLSVV